jgi:hypothetical protein
MVLGLLTVSLLPKTTVSAANGPFGPVVVGDQLPGVLQFVLTLVPAKAFHV